ncbi:MULTISPECIES: N-acetylmuramoyl-L-alanine amidase [unclassified Streptomyces]|uniref:N-acetylmuramoyl-L-alanine amidase n=1 Tax=unclassified Streptomyces TaxID=2593676 RepID=UPI002E2D5C40|nr:N-acetylmuramoyl-L-alanine amidase [Streptomyces sp. NBC_00223]
MFSNESRGGGRGSLRLVAVVAAAAVCLAGWLGYRASGGSGDGHPRDTAAGGTTPPAADGSADGSANGGAAGSATGGTVPGDAANAAGQSGNATGPSAETLPLTGKVVVLDPGHNPTNHLHTTEINRPVGIGTNRKECDTTGTETDAGYPEAEYTLDVSRRVQAILLARGAKVTLTQNGDRPYGPCVDERAEIGNKAHADAALSIHADGAPATAYGFHVIAPKSLHAGGADTRAIAAPSLRLANALRTHFAAATGEPFANYLGGGKGLTVRDDLGGLNLSTVPKVFIECGNMRNAHDAKALTDPAWRQKAAMGIADGLTTFLESKGSPGGSASGSASPKSTASSRGPAGPANSASPASPVKGMR